MERGQNWSDEEDVILCRAYMAVSEDQEIGTSQTKGKLWEKVAVEDNKKKPNGSEIRPAKGVEYHYNTLAKEVTKFCSFYE